MKTSPVRAESTTFSKDVLGRYVCNGLDEAIASTLGGTRPFDVVIVGGGSFGGALAQHLLWADKAKRHRILVLEAGQWVVPEHVQNLPTLGLFAPGAVEGDPGVRNEVWGIPWRTNVPGGFPGLAYAFGGRSLYWGGWAPRPLPEELPDDRWPAAVVSDLTMRYFDEAAAQIGVEETNDFVFGAMHETLRRALLDGLGSIPGAVPAAELPSHLPETDADGKPLSERQINERKLDAPLAVQGRTERSGFFPINKFSAAPLIMRAARQAYLESGGDDSKRRLMVVPNVHVTRLETEVTDGVGRVVAVHIGGQAEPIRLPAHGVVVLASGTIESTRLALESFDGVAGKELIGTNLMGHMRSNFTVGIPRSELSLTPNGDLQASALFVKGRRPHADGTVSTFHLQITAAGLHGIGPNSEAELFQKIPDIDTIDRFRAANEDTVVVTFRGVGEMQPGNPESRVTLSEERDEYGRRRAFVTIGDCRGAARPGESPQTANDRDTWAAMDLAAERALAAIADPAKCTVVGRNRDVLGSTHHEGGTLAMGGDPATSVTNPHGRFHSVVNAYATGPALLPTLGSPNPMLSGVALARRLAEHLVGSPPPALEPGFEWLFDGTQATFAKWRLAGPGGFELLADAGSLRAVNGSDIGLLYYADKAFDDFVLRLQFRVGSVHDNSGVFVRFADPANPPGGLDPKAAANPAFVAVFTGFEIQVDEQGMPDGADRHRTGAVYDVPEAEQSYRRGSPLRPGEWNDLEVEVRGQTYVARVNGVRTAHYTNPDPRRGLPAKARGSSGFVGLQSHNSPVEFRAIRIDG